MGKMEIDKRLEKESELLLLMEKQRRAEGDPLTMFVPFDKQRTFINNVLSRTFQENYYLGANRSGKSDAGCYTGATLARFGDQSDDVKWNTARGSDVSIRDRATSGWVVSLDFPSSRDIVQPKYFDNGFMPPGSTHEPFIPPREIAKNGWRVSDQILRLKNGSIIGYKSADSGRLKFQGTEKDWVHFDEEPPMGIYEETVIRVGARPLNIFFTCTLLPPEGQIGGVTWIYSEKVKPWQNGVLDNVGIVSASIYDNTYIPIPEIERLEAIYPSGSVQRRIRLQGELIPGLSGARIYSGFDYRLNVREQPDIALRRPLAWTWDFNVEPMVSLIGQRERGLFRVFRELILEEGNIAEMCDLFKQVHPMHLAEVHIYGDASGKSRSHQTKMSSYNLILNNMVDYPAPMRLKVPEKNPSIPDRINSMNRNFKTETGEIMIEIDPLCNELAEDFEQVISDGKGGIKKTFNRKDPYVKRTHTSDAMGYWVFAEAPVRPIRAEQSHPNVRVPSMSYERKR